MDCNSKIGIKTGFLRIISLNNYNNAGIPRIYVANDPSLKLMLEINLRDSRHLF